jgi:hypothetical protein
MTHTLANLRWLGLQGPEGWAALAVTRAGSCWRRSDGRARCDCGRTAAGALACAGGYMCDGVNGWCVNGWRVMCVGGAGDFCSRGAGGEVETMWVRALQAYMIE